MRKKIIRLNNMTPLMLLTLFLLFWITNGVFSYIYFYIPKLVKIGVFFLWLVLACMTDRLFISKIIRNEWMIMLYIVHLIIFSMCTDEDFSYALKTSFFLLVFYSIYIFYKDAKFDQRMLICKAILYDYIFISINTLIKLISIPNLSRYLSHDDEFIIANFGPKAALGVGNYTFAYSLVPVCFVMIVYAKKNINRIHSILCLLVFSLVLFRMEFTISVILLLGIGVCTLVIEYNRRKRMKSKNLLILFFLFVIVLCTIGFWVQILPSSISDKITELMTFLVTKDASRSVMARNRVYMISIKSIISNPILGAISIGTAGGHSTWLDTYALMGIFSWPIFFFVYKSIKEIKKQNLEIGNTYGLYWIILGLINNAYAPRIMLTFYCFIALAASLIKDTEIVVDEKVVNDSALWRTGRVWSRFTEYN